MHACASLSLRASSWSDRPPISIDPTFPPPHPSAFPLPPTVQIVDTSLVSLECLPALRCISLAHNRIERLAPGSFDACAELRELVLSDNTVRAVGGALVAATR